MKKIEKMLDVWNDRECLEEFSKFLSRVHIATEFTQDEDGFVTHQILHMGCGDSLISSSPQELEWPLVPASLPKEAGVPVN